MKFNTESILLKPVVLFFPNGSHQLLFFEVVGEPVCAAHEYFVSFWRRIHNACQVKKKQQRNPFMPNSLGYPIQLLVECKTTAANICK